MLRSQMKQKKKNTLKNNKTNIIYITIITILVISNICFLLAYMSINKEDRVIDEVLFTEAEGEFKPDKKYYATLSYKTFKKLYKGDSITTIAVVDNSTNTHDKFIEMINKTAYYKNTKIYLLEVNKLSKKNSIAFYELDDRLSTLETNYIISVSNNKILSITTFDNERLNKIVEGLGE